MLEMRKFRWMDGTAERISMKLDTDIKNRLQKHTVYLLFF